MENQFKFFIPTKICFEAGISKKVGQFIEGENVLIISDPFLYKSGIANNIGDCMNGKKVAYFSEVEPNPSCESVDKAAEVARDIKADCVIGLGGGSALDISKMVACMTTNEGSIYDYYAGGSRTLHSRKTKLICIPTTAGTGSEVTNVGVYTNKKTGRKLPMLSDLFWPDYAIIDSELTVTLPPAVTASTGMDAFTHAIEAYWNQDSQPMSDFLAMGAMKLILENLKTAYNEPSNLEARTAMSKASLIAGVAFSQTRTTGIHAISFPLTAQFGASHGVACAITLPAFIRISKEKAEKKMRQLINFLGFESLDSFADGIETLMKDIGLPTRLQEIGVKESDLEQITEVGLSAAIIQLTPAVMNSETVYRLLQSIL